MGDSPHKFSRHSRHDGWTEARRRDFVAALGRTGNVRDACKIVGLSNQAAYRLRARDKGFAAAWDTALSQSARTLEAVAFARAVEGVEEPIFSGGKQIGTRRKTSDGLLRLLLQGANPEKYGRTGAQASVQMREELEARVEEIEHKAYARAWRAFEAEYRWGIEPEYLRIWLMRQLHDTHKKLCGAPYCRECHPERYPAYFDDWDWKTDPGADHHPIDPPARWVNEARAEYMTQTRDHNMGGPPPPANLPKIHPAGSMLEDPDPIYKRDPEQHGRDCRAKQMGLPYNAWQRPGWIDPRSGKVSAARTETMMSPEEMRADFTAFCNDYEENARKKQREQEAEQSGGD